MTWQGFLQFFIFLGVALGLAPLGGKYLSAVYNGHKTPLDKVLTPIEQFIYRLCSIREDEEQTAASYIVSLLIFSLCSIIIVFIFLLLQKFLPLNPGKFPGLSFMTALQTAISAATNSGWKNYIPEKTISHFSHIAVLGVQHFISAGISMAVALAMIRGLVRKNSRTIGNFWFDLTRSVLWVLLPLALIFSVIFMASGVPQNFSGAIHATTLESRQQNIAEGPVASSVAAGLASSSGSGFFAATAAHPYENPNAFSNFAELLLMLIVPISFINFFGREVGDSGKGLALLLVMSLLFMTMVFTAYWAENQVNPLISNANMDQLHSDDNIGGNLEGKETRFGTAGSVLWAVTGIVTANSSANSSYDSMMPVSALVLSTGLMLNETVFGSDGSGLYKILVFVIITAFIANLLTGKIPEYLGKKIQPREALWLALAFAMGPAMMLGFAGLALFAPGIMRAISNPGPHGLIQIIYNYGSVAENNGSTFAGFYADSLWHNIAISFSMLFSRYFLIVCILSFAGSFAMKAKAPVLDKSFSTNNTTFVIMLLLMLIICTLLAFMPVMVMGPLAEQLMIMDKKSF